MSAKAAKKCVPATLVPEDKKTFTLRCPRCSFSVLMLSPHKEGQSRRLRERSAWVKLKDHCEAYHPDLLPDWYDPEGI